MGVCQRYEKGGTNVYYSVAYPRIILSYVESTALPSVKIISCLQAQ